MSMLWKDSYAMGIDQIDNQHKELFVTLDKLLSATKADKGAAEVPATMQFLMQYVKKHFETEEALMLAKKYPGYDEQKQAHTQCIATIESFNAELASCGGTPSTILVSKMQQKLGQWLVTHVCRLDKKLGNFLKQQ